MKKTFLTITVLLFYCFEVKAQAVNNNSDIEPKATFEISINGKKYRMVQDEILNFDTTFSKPSISIKLSENKKFNDSSISFEYPRQLTFEYTSSIGLKNWTFSGNNIVVLLFEFEVQVSLNSLIDEMVNKFGQKNCTIEDFTKNLGPKKLSGKRLHVILVGVKLVLDFYEIILPENKTWYIGFQNTINDDGTSTEEYKHVFNVIDSTISYR